MLKSICFLLNLATIRMCMQPVYSPSLLVDMMRPDGSSTIPVLNGEPLSADLAHEMMGIQVNIEENVNFLSFDT